MSEVLPDVRCAHVSQLRARGQWQALKPHLLGSPKPCQETYSPCQVSLASVEAVGFTLSPPQTPCWRGLGPGIKKRKETAARPCGKQLCTEVVAGTPGGLLERKEAGASIRCGPDLNSQCDLPSLGRREKPARDSYVFSIMGSERDTEWK